MTLKISIDPDVKHDAVTRLTLWDKHELRNSIKPVFCN